MGGELPDVESFVLACFKSDKFRDFFFRFVIVFIKGKTKKQCDIDMTH